MHTYQDLLNIADASDQDRIEFCSTIVREHKASDLYKTAAIANDYDRHRNTTIVAYQKLLYTVSGNAVPDNWSANYKLASNFFHRFALQQNQFLLGNGVQWQNEDTAAKLGDDFDIQLQKLGHAAIVGGVSFGFWNLDHMDVFSVLEFAPIYDEENGALRGGVRFWQIDAKKPIRYTLYEENGYTDYMLKDGKGSVVHEKRTYIQSVRTSEADGTEIYNLENYPAFPIVPLWANPQKQSEIVGIREQIDAYDLIKSGFCNTVDEASLVYWTITNAGGMDDTDLAQFVERMKTVRAVNLDDEVKAESHTIEAPFDARETLLDRIRKDLYEDYMALDIKEIAGGAVTATQIKAAYEPMNSKADEYEYCIHDFIDGLFAIVGIDDEPTFTRSTMINASEEITTVIQAASYLGDDYVTRKILSILGDTDQADEIIARMDADELDRADLNNGE